jgi:glucose/arabinose dehydrogenase
LPAVGSSERAISDALGEEAMAVRKPGRDAVARLTLIEALERRTLFTSLAVAGFADEQVIAGISSGTAMDFAPDGRLFVTQQSGALRVIKNGSLLATPFTSLTVDSSGERGMLGLAFDPNYATNRFVYVYHTVPAPAGGSAHNRITRFTADAANPDVAVAGSAVPILDLDNLSSATNHNGGAIHFGLDGKLYVAVGENANSANAQSLNTRLGKILRINSDGSIPADNPFFNTATGANRAIWALGLRNPFTFTVQPGTGTLYVNDVGANTWEEVNVGVAGANYGWPTIEGFRTTQTPPANYHEPLAVYRHPTTGSDPNATGYAITGGAFYNPSTPQFPVGYQGDYFFADTGGTSAGHWIRKLEAGTNTSSLFASSVATPVDLKVGPDGKLYYLERANGGRVGRIAATGVPSVASVQVGDGSSQRSRVASLTVTFSREVSVDAGAFSVVGRGMPAGNIGVVVAPASGAATSFTLTFSGSSVGADGSLPDGVYDLTIGADKVHNSTAASTTMAANFTSTFHRLLADASGDARIGPEDFNILATNFAKTGQTAGTGDFNGDGTTGPEDFNILASRFGTALDPPAGAALLAESPQPASSLAARHTTANTRDAGGPSEFSVVAMRPLQPAATRRSVVRR